MKKFSLLEKPRNIIHLQAFRGSPGTWASLGVAGHIGVDISRGDVAGKDNGDPIPAYYQATIVYVDRSAGTVVYLTEPDSNGECLEVSVAHLERIKVNVGDKVHVGQIIGLQDCHGPSLAWRDEIERDAWSHEHLSIRIAKLGKLVQELKWNFQENSPIPYHIVECDPTMEHFRDPNLWNVQLIEAFARAIATHEGFTTGASRPAVECNNPGNLRYSPLADGYRDYGTATKPNKFAHFANIDIGWAALRRDIEIKATGRSAHMKATDSIQKFFEVYAPGSDHNDSGRYAQVVVDFVGVMSVSDPISVVMMTELEYIRKYRDFSFGWYVNAETKGAAMASIYKTFRAIYNYVFGGW